MGIFAPWDDSFIKNQNNYQNIDKKDDYLLKMFRSLTR